MVQKPKQKQMLLKILLTGFVSFIAFGADSVWPQSKTNVTDALVLRLTEKLTETDRKGVVVMDMEPAFGPPSSFGPWLAAQVSSSLADQGQGFEVIDRQRLGAALEAQHLSNHDEWDMKNAIALAKSLRATTVVIGSYGAIGNGIGVTLTAICVSECGSATSKNLVVGSASGKLILDDQLPAHMNPQLEDSAPTDDIYRAGYGGVSVPSCTRCPPPTRLKVPDVDASGMLRAYPSGTTIWLRFVVTPEGRTRNISTVQAVGFGFDEKYVDAVKDWEFKPAVDPDKRPVAVHFELHTHVSLK